jgi:F-type H+-transporting ATPase subunit b
MRLALLGLGLVFLAALPALAAGQKRPGGTTAPAAAAAAPADHPAEAETGGETAHANPNILEAQIPLAFWTLIVFAVLMLVLSRYAWKPLSKALHDREHFMEQTLAQAETARAESERLLAEHRRLMDAAGKQAQDLVEEARRGATSAADEIRRTAQSEAEATIQRAQREIAAAKDQALLEIWNRSADLTVSLASKVIGRELKDTDHRRLIDEAMAELPAHSNGATAQGTAS